MRVCVQSNDGINKAGLVHLLSTNADLEIVPDTPADVVMMAVDRVSCEALSALKRSEGLLAEPVVLVSHDTSDLDLATLMECNIVTVIANMAVTPTRLAHAVLGAPAAHGQPPSVQAGDPMERLVHLQDGLLSQSERNSADLSVREVEILRLVADGNSTEEIAEMLRYSVRTVKGIIYAVTSRLDLRNRSHAVAYALRRGLI